MASFSQMYSSLGINIQNFSRGLRQATTQLNSFASNTKSKVNQAAGSFDRASDNVKAFGRNMKGQTSSAMEAMEDLRKNTEAYGFTLKSVSRIVSGIIISQAFYNAVQNIRNATNAVWEFTKQLEYAKIAYSNLFGDTSLALEFINVLKDFAAKTPFTFTDAESAAKRLLAYGIEYKNIMYVMQGVLAAASMQGDPTKIESISRALGQIYTYGKLMTAEVRQLSEAGIPAYEILQEELGLTQEQLRNLGNEAIPASKAINALVDGMQKRFGNVVAASSMTITGIISNIKDNATMLFAGLFESTSVAIKSALAALGQFLFTLRDIEETAGPGGVFEALFPPELHDTLRLFVANIKVAINSIIMFVMTLVSLLKPVLISLIGVYNAFAPILQGVANIFTAVLYVISNNSTAMRILTGAIAAAAAMWVVFKVKAVAASIAAAVITVISKALTGLSAMLSFVVAHPFWALLIGLSGIVIGLSTGFGNLGNKVRGFFKQLTSFNGVDADSILMPSQEDRANDLEKFNNALDGTSDSMDELADSAGKAGKAGQKAMKGLLSFDEVFKLNEPDETTGSGSGNGIDTSGLEDMLGEIGSIGSGYMPEVPDFSDYINGVVDAFMSPFRAAWEGIKSRAATIISSAITGAFVFAFSLIKQFVSNLAMFGGFTGIFKALTHNFSKNLKSSLKTGIIGAIVSISVGFLADRLTEWLVEEFNLTEQAFKNADTGQMIGSLVGMIVGAIFGGPVGSIVGSALGQLAGSIVGAFWEELGAVLKGSITGGTAGLPIGAIVGLIVGALGGPIGAGLGAAIGTAIGIALGGLAGLISDNWEAITDWLDKAIESLKDFVDNVITTLSTAWDTITSTLGKVLGDIFGAIGTVLSDIFKAVGTFHSDVFNAVKTVWSDIFNAISTVLHDIWDAVSSIFTLIKDIIVKILEEAFGFISNVWNRITTYISNKCTAIYNTISQYFNLAKEIVRSIVDFIWQKIDERFGHIFDAISTNVRNAYNAVRDWFTQISKAITDNVTKAYNYVRDWFLNIYNSIKTNVYNAYVYVRDWFLNIYSKIKENIHNAYTYVRDFFKDMYESIRNRITDMYTSVKDGTKNIYKTFTDWVSDLYNNTFGKLFGWLDTGIEKIREFLKLDDDASKRSQSNNYSRSYATAGVTSGSMPGHATGGIFTREHVARFAEGNKAEAVVPLENASAMQPFVDAISRGILEGLAPTLIQTNSGGSNDLPPMYVGTLVADDRGLKQLYRKFELIKVQEDARRGLAY